jgi:MMP 1-O-methyltransferase
MSLAALEGLISDRQGERLTELAALVPLAQAIVELGSYKGKSTAYLAASGHRVYAIDRWTLGGQRIRGMGYADPETLKAFGEQIRAAGVSHLITPLIGDTVQMAHRWRHGPIGLLFIDADHSEKAVRADLEAWEPHLAPDAIVAFDDYAERWPGVMAVADELRARGKRWERTENLMAVWT